MVWIFYIVYASNQPFFSSSIRRKWQWNLFWFGPHTTCSLSQGEWASHHGHKSIVVFCYVDGCVRVHHNLLIFNLLTHTRTAHENNEENSEKGIGHWEKLHTTKGTGNKLLSTFFREIMTRILEWSLIRKMYSSISEWNTSFNLGTLSWVYIRLFVTKNEPFRYSEVFWIEKFVEFLYESSRLISLAEFHTICPNGPYNTFSRARVEI